MINLLRGLKFKSWRAFQEDPESLDDVRQTQQIAASAYLAFFIMLALSSVIATNGLIADSPATVIGAMIIAPLMQPIGAMAFGLATTDRRLLAHALFTTLCGIACTIAIAYLASLLVGVHTVGHEIVNRTAPTALDLVVAVSAGAAAAFAATRRSIGDAIPGVAIAVALVPPLCVVGIGLALGDSAIPKVGLVLSQDVAYGALLLFCANLAGIIFSGAVVYIIQGYGRWTSAARGVLITVAIIIALVFPLWFALRELLLQQQVQSYLVGLRQQRPEIYQNVIMRRLQVDVLGEEVHVDLEAICPRDMRSRIPQEIEYVREYLTGKLDRVVEVKSTIILADIVEVKAQSEEVRQPSAAPQQKENREMDTNH